MDVREKRDKFEEIKNSINKAQDYLLIGIDISKDKHDACVMVSSGQMINRRLGFENNLKGFQAFVKRIQDYQRTIKPNQTIIGIETTGNYVYPLANYLSKEGFTIVMVSSFVTKRNRDTIDLTWNKNDIKDAYNIVDCMKQGKIQFYNDTDQIYGDIRRLVGLYMRLSTERGLNVIRLQNNVLCISFPEFTKIYNVVSELVPMTILERYPLPSDIIKLKQKDFVEEIRQNSDLSIKRSKLVDLYKLAKISIGSTINKDSLRSETRFIVSDIKYIFKEQKKILEQIQYFCNQCPEYKLMQTIPGVGPVISAGFIAEIGDINKYNSARQILKLAGLNLSKIQSGKFEGETHISRRGRPRLRSLAFQAGLVAVRSDTRLKFKYLHMIEKKNIKKGAKRKIIIAISSKLLKIVYAVMKNKIPYDKYFDQKWKKKALCIN